MKKRLNIGMIGHKFMGKAHSYALREIPLIFDLEVDPVMKVICGVEDDIAQAAEKYGWESYETSWEKVVDNPEIDIIDIASPGVTHKEIAVAAARKGKHILCEKPLAMTFDEAKEMYESAEENKVKHMVNFNYRRIPAVNLARKLVEEGKLGKIYNFNATYQQDWPLDEKFPFVWRFDKSIAGAGSLADKGSHVIDLARMLIGEFEEISCTTDIFVKERTLPGAGGSRKEVTTDDAAVFIARFKNGALGLFETSRMCAGHRNSLAFEINGSKGSVKFTMERFNELDVFFTEDIGEVQGFRNILVTHPDHEYMKYWWPTGHILGWGQTFTHQYYEFLKAINEDYMPTPSFYDGMKNQEIIEAAQRAALEKRWIKI